MVINKRHLEVIQHYFLSHHETLAVAESVSAGLLQAAFSGAPEAAKFFQGGITTYNIGQKSRHLKIDPIHGISCNCVSPLVAAQMAVNVSELFSSTWGIGITGYASPVIESGQKLFAFYAISFNRQVILSNEIIPKKNSPAKVQLLYVNELIKIFATYFQQNKT